MTATTARERTTGAYERLPNDHRRATHEPAASGRQRHRSAFPGAAEAGIEGGECVTYPRRDPPAPRRGHPTEGAHPMSDEHDRINRATTAAVFGTRAVDPDELRTDEDRAGREFARSLFGRRRRTPDEPQPTPAKPVGYVAREGSNPAPTNDRTELNAVRDIFGNPDPA